MRKRRRKSGEGDEVETGRPVEGMEGVDAPVDKVRAAVFQNEGAINAVAQACRNLKRIQDPGPEHIMKFIDRVFTCAGVDRA